MKLFEVEGKKLLNKYGISTPEGWLRNEIPPHIEFPVIAKAQVLTGGRGKAGGIKHIHDKQQLDDTIPTLLDLEIKGEKVRDVYVEGAVNFKKELYLSIIMDRTHQSPLILASSEGGVDIEETAKNKIISVPVNPLLELQPYIIQRISRFLNVDFRKAEDLLQRLWNVFMNEKAELVEINPLFINEDGNFIAGDAKVVLTGQEDQRDERLIFSRSTEGFEERCQQLKVAGTKLDGDISIIASGAGLGMATLDIVAHTGGSVHSLIDLQGHIIHDLEGAKRLIQELQKTSPKGYLFNFYFQLASCKTLSEAIASELGNSQVPVVVRMKGNDQEEAEADLKQFPNIVVTENLRKACETILFDMKERA